MGSSAARDAAPRRSALAGRGALVLLAGEAGVGKTRLAEAALRGAPLLRGAAQPPRRRRLRAGRRGAALRPARATRRARRRAGRCGRISRCCCRSSARRRRPSDRATLFEAIRCALAHARARARAARRPAVVRRRDARAARRARGAAARAAAAGRRRVPLRRVGRGHPLRRLRADLRRGRLLRELVVAPLDAAGEHRRSPRACSAAAPSPALAARAVRPHAGRAVLRRRSSPPRCRRAIASARARTGSSSTHDGDVPVPETIRDAVLLRTAGLSPDGRAAAEAAAVAGRGLRARPRRRAWTSCSRPA